MSEPKKRHSRARQGKRRAAIKQTLLALVKCPNCKSEMLPHTVCKNCGFYFQKKKGQKPVGREILEIKSKKVTKVTRVTP